MDSNRDGFVRRKPGFVNRVETIIGRDLNHDGWIGGMPYFPYGYSIRRTYRMPITGYGIYQPIRYF